MYSSKLHSLLAPDLMYKAQARTVAEGDIEGMAALYHSDAVLVVNSRTVPIAEQLAKWGQDMEEAKRNGSTASVSFRPGQRP